MEDIWRRVFSLYYQNLSCFLNNTPNYHYCAILGLRRQNPYVIGLPQGMWKGNTWEDQHGTFNHPWQDSYVRRYRPNTVFDQQIS